VYEAQAGAIFFLFSIDEPMPGAIDEKYYN
jgi:hypothetical protein